MADALRAKRFVRIVTAASRKPVGYVVRLAWMGALLFVPAGAPLVPGAWRGLACAQARVLAVAWSGVREERAPGNCPAIACRRSACGIASRRASGDACYEAA